MLPELDRRFSRLEEDRRALMEELAAYPREAIEQSPEPDAWCMRQVAQHLMMVEQAFLRYKDTHSVLRPPNFRQRIGRWAVKLVLGMGIKIKAPSRHVLPEEELTLPEVDSRWIEVRQNFGTWLASLSSEQARELRFLHPFAGPLDSLAFLDFLADHFEHHRRQIRRIAASSAFRALTDRG